MKTLTERRFHVILNCYKNKGTVTMKPEIKLQYVGKQEFPGHDPVKLWNIICEGHPRHMSTVSLITLHQLGIVEEKYTGAFTGRVTTN